MGFCDYVAFYGFCDYVAFYSGFVIMLLFIWFLMCTYLVVVVPHQQPATLTLMDRVHDLIHHILAMRCILPELVPELIRDQHRHRVLLQPSHSRLVVVVNEILVSDRTQILRTPADRRTIDELTSVLVGLEHDEILAHHANPLTLVALGGSMRDVPELASSLPLQLVNIHRQIVGILIIVLIREPGVGAGLATRIRRPTVHAKGTCEPTRTLATHTMAHLVPDGGDDEIVGETRIHLDDDRADLKAAGRRVNVSLHLLGIWLGDTDDILTILNHLAPEDRRSILQDASRGVVLVGDADPTATIGDPDTRLRHGGVGAVVSVSGKRHC